MAFTIIAILFISGCDNPVNSEPKVIPIIIVTEWEITLYQTDGTFVESFLADEFTVLYPELQNRSPIEYSRIDSDVTETWNGYHAAVAVAWYVNPEAVDLLN